jgi:N-methylhydantoinase A
MRLDEAAAARSLSGLAGRLGLSDVELAEGILAIINAKMADAIRTITVRQGIDPREFSLVAFGGAGPMHAVWLAAELEVGEVIVPWSPGTFSAWGMLHTDIRHDLNQTFYKALDGLEAAAVDEIYDGLAAEGRAVLRSEEVAEPQMYVARSADMRYVGQEYSVNVAVGEPADLAAVEAAFHDAHRARYGHATPSAPVEFVNLRLAAMGRLARGADGFEPGDGELVLEARPVVFDGDATETSIVQRRHLRPGAALAGPVVVEEETATTVVPPGWRVDTDQLGNLRITRVPEARR